MTPLLFTLITFFASVAAGVLGSLLGLGGGIIVVPLLTLAMGVDIKHAIGASIVSVIATSSGAGAAYVRERMTNVRVAMLLEVATVSGAITGAYLAGLFAGRGLFLLFGALMAYSAIAMSRGKHEHHGAIVPPDPLADRLKLHGSYFDAARGHDVHYRVAFTKLGFGLMYLAGVASGLLGIGSGVFKVPAMDLAMRMPIKASTATSNFMIGVTAAASAGVWFSRGDVNPFIAAPVASGVTIGAVAGSKLLGRLAGRKIRLAFVVVLLVVAGQMLWKGAHT
ncbi:MAG TPA: sulfite exporter TauE/SafE family protein [Phycisphaerales bacterium]|nr:sulfite exporter TauE/SafE family protein [Phycisphaerales bacterium]